MSSYILDKAYAIDEAEGVGAYRAVVNGDDAGEAKLPAGANAGGILGVTVHGQSRQGGHVAVRKAGIARVTAAGAVALGAPVNIDGATGKIKAIDETQGTAIQCLGFAETPAGADGDVIEVFISIHERTAP
jgi:hypothetical protein